MQGYLLKKKEKLGKWKQLYFVLKQDVSDNHLYFYDHPKRTKPKGLIDLSHAYLYTVLYIDIRLVLISPKSF
jgi:Ras GTPase-activating protein 1